MGVKVSKDNPYIANQNSKNQRVTQALKPKSKL